jgi:hypothetical protein
MTGTSLWKLVHIGPGTHSMSTGGFSDSLQADNKTLTWKVSILPIYVLMIFLVTVPVVRGKKITSQVRVLVPESVTPTERRIVSTEKKLRTL